MSDDDITRKALERLYTAFTVKGGGEDGTARSWSKRVEEALNMATVALDTKLPDLPDMMMELGLHIILERMELDETSFVRFAIEEDDEEVAVILATTSPHMVKVLTSIDADGAKSAEPKRRVKNPDFDIN